MLRLTTLSRTLFLSLPLLLATAGVSAQAEPAAGEPERDEAHVARDSEARHLFEAGRNAYDDGRYKDALDYFQHGYELSQRAQLLYNVGQAADRLRKDQVAVDAFKLYLEKLPAAENRAQVEERIRVLDEVLAERRAAGAAPVAATTRAEPSPPAAGPLAPEAAPPPRDESDDNLLNQWWVWAAAGGVVAGVVIVAVVAGSGGGGTRGEVTQGSNGMTIAALTFE